MDNDASLYFLIESGPMLEAVKTHIDRVSRLHEINLSMCKEIGVDAFTVDRLTGLLSGVRFNVNAGLAVLPGWTKPDKRGVSYPKKGSHWDKAIKALEHNYQPDFDVVAELTGVPRGLDYRKDGCEGSCVLGMRMDACGFLWLSEEGPFAFWIPDVQAQVKSREDEGYEVTGPAKDFKAEFEGCRQIRKEEWDLLVAQHELKEAQAADSGSDVDDAYRNALNHDLALTLKVNGTYAPMDSNEQAFALAVQYGLALQIDTIDKRTIVSFAGDEYACIPHQDNAEAATREAIVKTVLALEKMRAG